MTGCTNADSTVVLVRSYSRHSRQMSDDSAMDTSGQSRRSSAPTARSFASLA